MSIDCRADLREFAPQQTALWRKCGSDKCSTTRTNKKNLFYNYKMNENRLIHAWKGTDTSLWRKCGSDQCSTMKTKQKTYIWMKWDLYMHYKRLIHEWKEIYVWMKRDMWINTERSIYETCTWLRTNLCVHNMTAISIQKVICRELYI